MVEEGPFLVGPEEVTSRKRVDPNCWSPNICPLRLGLAGCHAVGNGGRPPQPSLVRKCLFIPQGKFVLEFLPLSHLVTERQCASSVHSLVWGVHEATMISTWILPACYPDTKYLIYIGSEIKLIVCMMCAWSLQYSCLECACCVT